MFTIRFVRSLTNLFISIVTAFLSLRIILKLFGASTQAPFVRWTYETTEPLLRPFIGMFPSPNLTRGLEIEFSALFALMAYVFLGYLIQEVLLTIEHGSNKK
ncbi:MAG: YggT family protein [Patescibacteria group bacterium]